MLIKFHELNDDVKDIVFKRNSFQNWDLLKKEFINFKFNSIINKEKTWEKYINTFNQLIER